MGGLGRGIKASRRDSSRLGGEIIAPRHVSTFVGYKTCLLGYILRSNSYKAFFLDLSVLNLAVLA